MTMMGFMQIVPGSYKPYPCAYCEQDTGGGHSPSCPIVQEHMPPYDPIPQSQIQGEQCGRCWQNHVPGTVCMCSCHTTQLRITTPSSYDNGDDLDAPQNT